MHFLCKAFPYNKSLTSPLLPILSPFDLPSCHPLPRVIGGNNCYHFDVYESRDFSTFIYMYTCIIWKMYITCYSAACSFQATVCLWDFCSCQHIQSHLVEFSCYIVSHGMDGPQFIPFLIGGHSTNVPLLQAMLIWIPLLKASCVHVWMFL